MNIFLFGPMGAGKDEFAAYMERKYGFRSFALADNIRKFIKSRNPDYVPKSDRALEIDVGTKFRQWFGADYWCGQVEIDIIQARKLFFAKDVIIRDGRFVHEYRYFVEKRRFTPVKIVCDPEVRKERLVARDGAWDPKTFYSPNDCEIITWPGREIRNDGTLEEFYAQIDAMVEELREGRGAA